MSAPFDLRFVMAVRPLLPTCDLQSLIPYDVPAYMPVDDDAHLPPLFIQKNKDRERRKCVELKNLSDRFDGSDVIHFVVGFMLSDYEAVAACDVMRRHYIREAVWSLLRSMLVEYDADSIDYVVAMHLDSEVPHVHVVMSRYARSGVALKRINTLPARLLPLN